MGIKTYKNKFDILSPDDLLKDEEINDDKVQYFINIINEKTKEHYHITSNKIKVNFDLYDLEYPTLNINEKNLIIEKMKLKGWKNILIQKSEKNDKPFYFCTFNN